jgi:two-component system, cell cycle sensor histidine kinase and response regulator CckA
LHNSGIEQFKNNTDISLVILDLNMPYMSGEQTVIELRKIDDNINVIISTGYLMTDIDKRYNVGIIIKPYEITELIKKIEEHHI